MGVVAMLEGKWLIPTSSKTHGHDDNQLVLTVNEIINISSKSPYLTYVHKLGLLSIISTMWMKGLLNMSWF